RRAARASRGWSASCGFRLEAGQVRMRDLTVMDAQPSEFGAAMQRRHAFAWIEQPRWIERGFHAQQALELDRLELRAHAFEPLDTDPVLAGDRAAHRDAKVEDVRTEALRGLEL